MNRLRFLLNRPITFWTILALPGCAMTFAVFTSGDPAELLHPTGEFAVRLMIVAMMVTPLRLLFPGAGWTFWLLQRRRALGVAAFGYVVLHTLFYVLDKGTLRAVATEFAELGIWTGWAAMLIMVALAVTSNDASQLWLRRRWKTLQRFVYPAALLTIVHWLFVQDEWAGAVAHFAPLAALETYRIVHLVRTRSHGRKEAVGIARAA